MIPRSRLFLKLFGVLLLVTFAAFLIRSGYNHTWTGFQGYVSKGELIPPKKLWDWMSLLVVPLGLAVAAYYLNKRQKESELQKTINQQQETSLQAFITQMSDLLLTHNLRGSKSGDGVRMIARARALTVLKELDGKRKGLMIRFLVESRLLQREGTIEEQIDRPIVRLTGGDLRGADLSYMDLSKVVFDGVDLTGANLQFSSLTKAERDAQTKIDEKWDLVWKLASIWFPPPKDALRGKDLSNANLTGVRFKGFDLSGTDLRGSILDKANFYKAKIDNTTKLEPKWVKIWKLVNYIEAPEKLAVLDLTNANLSAHVFENADLSACDLTGANLESAELPDAKLTGTFAVDVNFANANLERADLTNARLALSSFHRANLSDSRMIKVDLDWTNLDGAVLRNADLSGATFDQCSLEGADLTSANLAGAKFKNTTFGLDTKWPAGFDVTTTPGLSLASSAATKTATPAQLPFDVLDVPY